LLFCYCTHLVQKKADMVYIAYRRKDSLLLYELKECGAYLVHRCVMDSIVHVLLYWRKQKWFKLQKKKPFKPDTVYSAVQYSTYILNNSNLHVLAEMNKK
jgi:hypothetical protein